MDGMDIVTAGPRGKCQCSPCRKYTTPPGEQDAFIPILLRFLMEGFFVGMGVVMGIGFSSGASYASYGGSDVRSSDLPVLPRFLMIVFLPHLYTLQASVSNPMKMTNSKRHELDGRT